MQKVMEARATESARQVSYFSLRAFFEGFYYYSIALVVVPLVLVPLIAGGHPLPASTLFSAIGLVQILIDSGLVQFNDGLGSLANILSVLRRIEAVLQLPEHRPTNHLPPLDPKNTIEAHSASASWEMKP